MAVRAKVNGKPRGLSRDGQSRARSSAQAIAPPRYGVDLADSGRPAVSRAAPITEVTVGPTIPTAALEAGRAAAPAPQVRSILHGPAVQAKLKIGAPNDPAEAEADRVADRVLRMPEKDAQWGTSEDEHALRRQLLEEQETEEIRRQPNDEEEEELQLKQAPTGETTSVSPRLASRIGALSGGGSPLPERVRAYFEPRFGHSFSDVSVHTDRRAGQAARTLNARAFTLGRDIAFGAGQYAPDTAEGKRLLAHELAHVVQGSAASDLASRSFGLGGAVSSPQILRKPSRPSLNQVFVDFAGVKKHLQSKFPELYELVKSNPFNGEFAEARRETIEGREHIWKISVDFINDLRKLPFGINGLTVPAKSPPGKPHVHQIEILLNLNKFEDEALKKQFPNLKDRTAISHAKTLAHELIHAAQQIEGTPGAKGFKAVAGLRQLLEAANSAAFRKEKVDVLFALMMLADIAGIEKADRRKFAQKQYDHFVEEKYAFYTTESAFGKSFSANKWTARSYSGKLAKALARKHPGVSKQDLWERWTGQLNVRVKDLFDKIDATLSAGGTPSKSPTPPQQTAPQPRP